MNINELKRKRADLVAQAKSIQAQLSSEDIEYTDDQREKLEAKQDECIGGVKDIDAKLEEAEAKAEASRKRAEQLDALDKQFQPQAKTAPQQPSNPVITGGVPMFTKDPMKGFSSPREFFQLALKTNPDNRNAIQDDRLKYLATAGTDEQIGNSDPYGGFLVPEGMSPNLMQLEADSDPFVGKMTVVPMDAPTVKVNARVDKDHSSSVSGGFTVSRSAETASKTASRGELEQIKLEANSVFGFAYATEELLRDSPRSVAGLLEAGFRQEFPSNRVKELLRGTGVGQPEGIQNTPSLITVAKESGQSADTVVYQNIIKMSARLWRKTGAFWLYNHNVEPQLKQLVLPIGTGGVPMWQTSLVSGAPNMLDGMPAYATEYCETVGDLYDIMLVKPSEILYGVYQPLESAESIHVRFDRHERAFKFWLRDDAKPWWRSALTPNKGSTLSPFVTLAARA